VDLELSGLSAGVLRHALLALAAVITTGRLFGWLLRFAGIAVSFVLGVLLALPLYPRWSGGTVPLTGFALLLGVALSMTAFPVLARILAVSTADGAMRYNPAASS
jgi:Kef-type K+ transport system membrane component KefB